MPGLRARGNSTGARESCAGVADRGFESLSRVTDAEGDRRSLINQGVRELVDAGRAFNRHSGFIGIRTRGSAQPLSGSKHPSMGCQ